MPQEFMQGATLVTLLGIAGLTARWLWTTITGRLDKRQGDMDAREKMLGDMVDARLAEMKGTIARMAERVETLGELVGKQRSAIHLLMAEVARNNPDSQVFAQVDALLGADFPIFLRAIPPEIAEILRTLDDDGEKS